MEDGATSRGVVRSTTWRWWGRRLLLWSAAGLILLSAAVVKLAGGLLRPSLRSDTGAETERESMRERQGMSPCRAGRCRPCRTAALCKESAG